MIRGRKPTTCRGLRLALLGVLIGLLPAGCVTPREGPDPAVQEVQRRGGPYRDCLLGAFSAQLRSTSDEDAAAAGAFKACEAEEAKVLASLAARSGGSPDALARTKLDLRAQMKQFLVEQP